MNRRSGPAADDLGEQHLDVAAQLERAGPRCPAGSWCRHGSLQRKKWACAHFRTAWPAPGRLRKLSGEDSTARQARGRHGRGRGTAAYRAGMDDVTRSDPDAAVDAFLLGLGGDTRRVAAGEWGLTLEAAGWPLHVGVALRDGLLRAQAEVAGPGQIDPHVLLRWNRELPLVRFSHTRRRRGLGPGRPAGRGGHARSGSTGFSGCWCGWRRRRARPWPDPRAGLRPAELPRGICTVSAADEPAGTTAPR